MRNMYLTTSKPLQSNHHVNELAVFPAFGIGDGIEPSLTPPRGCTSHYTIQALFFFKETGEATLSQNPPPSESNQLTSLYADGFPRLRLFSSFLTKSFNSHGNHSKDDKGQCCVVPKSRGIKHASIPPFYGIPAPEPLFGRLRSPYGTQNQPLHNPSAWHRNGLPLSGLPCK